MATRLRRASSPRDILLPFHADNRRDHMESVAMTLYNCRHAGDQYRITKFDEHMNVESSYLIDDKACECPAFERRSRCRHQEMLPKFIARSHIGDEWFLDFD